MKGENPKRLRKFLLPALIFGLLVFWFITAPAAMAVQRIAAGTGNGPIARCVIRAADVYSVPMGWIYKFPGVKKFNDALADMWCDILAAPETTP